MITEILEQLNRIGIKVIIVPNVRSHDRAILYVGKIDGNFDDCGPSNCISAEEAIEDLFTRLIKADKITTRPIMCCSISWRWNPDLEEFQQLQN